MSPVLAGGFLTTGPSERAGLAHTKIQQIFVCLFVFAFSASPQRGILVPDQELNP